MTRTAFLLALIFTVALGRVSRATEITAVAAGYVMDSIPVDGTFDLVSSPLATRIEIFRSNISAGLARGVLEYDIQGLAPFGSVAEIASVELNLFPLGFNLTGIGGAPADVDLYVYQADGVLTQSDASVAGESFVTTFNASSTRTPITLDVTSLVAPLLVAGTATHIGFRMQLQDESVPPTVGVSVGTRDPLSARHPTLVVTPVPEPSSIALLGIAGIGLFSFGRRRVTCG